MTPKQLANVLIKILGLSMCVQAIPGILSGALSALRVLNMTRSSGFYDFWIYPGISLVTLAIGMWLIVYSQQITDKLFKEP